MKNLKSFRIRNVYWLKIYKESNLIILISSVYKFGLQI